MVLKSIFVSFRQNRVNMFDIGFSVERARFKEYIPLKIRDGFSSFSEKLEEVIDNLFFPTG